MKRLQIIKEKTALYFKVRANSCLGLKQAGNTGPGTRTQISVKAHFDAYIHTLSHIHTALWRGRVPPPCSQCKDFSSSPSLILNPQQGGGVQPNSSNRAESAAGLPQRGGKHGPDPRQGGRRFSAGPTTKARRGSPENESALACLEARLGSRGADKPKQSHVLGVAGAGLDFLDVRWKTGRRRGGRRRWRRPV